MKLQWFDDGEACLTALGAEYNYLVTAVQGRRLWLCEQTWYRTDLATTILLKATWMPDSVAAVNICQSWEDGYESINKMDRSRIGRMREAAKNTRERRKALRERAHGNHQ